jgi:restriction system protein
VTIPAFKELFNLVVDALNKSGGAATIKEIDEYVEGNLLATKTITELEAQLPHNPNRPDRTELQYRLAWARTYLKKTGFLENSERGIWVLTALARAQKINSKQIVREVGRGLAEIAATGQSQLSTTDIALAEDQSWEEQLLAELVTIDPAAFERLCQRLLREAGFTQVEVTGRAGDGGIDGRGIMKLGELLSFHVFFQCKRYRGQVSSGELRDFRGAMVGRGDKGLFITTGGFTRDAMKEATRDGAPPIELVDGDALCTLLKTHRLGVSTALVESVAIHPEWFKSL